MNEGENKRAKYERTTQQQLEFYIRFCKAHPELQSGKNCPKSPHAVQELWEECASNLNGMRGPTRTAAKWKETLAVWKSQLRSRARKRKAELSMTGGGPSTSAVVSDFEQLALQTLEAAAVDGIAEVITLGMPTNGGNLLEEDYITSFYEGWRDLMDNKSDPRTRDWPLMSSPFPTIAISLAYAYFVKVLGPRLMENRKPFQLRKVLIVYNFIQVIFSAWLFYESCIGGWLNGYNIRCEPVDYSKTSRALRTASGCWWYFFSKFTEFFDTFFFVLRKRYDQVSTLHVIHHGIMPVSVWWGVKFTPGGHSTFFGFLNTFVHIIMYSYYMLAAMGPKVQKYLWWKKYLTVLQMIQFVLVMVHSFQLFFKNDCNYPIGFAYFIGAHAVMFYFLFSDFYKQAYLKKEQKKEKLAAAAALLKSQSNGYITNGVVKNGSAINSEINGNTKFCESMSKIEDYCNGTITSPTATTTRQRFNAGSSN